MVAGGSAVAANRWLITSTHQIKPSVLRQLHGARGSTGPVGVRGPAGLNGLPGAQGPAGGFSTANVIETTGAQASMCASGGGPCDVGGSFAACPPGAVVLGGGWSGPLSDASIGFNLPIGNGSAWDVVAINNAPIAESFTPYAVCAVGSGAMARARGNVAADASRYLELARAHLTP
jgi:hypothetical protein